MLLTLLLSPIISGSLAPLLLVVLAFMLLLPVAGLWLLVRGIKSLRDGGSPFRLTMGLVCLAVTWWFMANFEY